jgi:hypothetical protein
MPVVQSAIAIIPTVPFKKLHRSSSSGEIRLSTPFRRFHPEIPSMPLHECNLLSERFANTDTPSTIKVLAWRRPEV